MEEMAENGALLAELEKIRYDERGSKFAVWTSNVPENSRQYRACMAICHTTAEENTKANGWKRGSFAANFTMSRRQT